MSRRLHLTAMAAAFAMIASVVLGGCATVPTGGSKGGAFCDVARPLIPTAADAEAVSLGLARQIAAHNRFGAASCGWTP